MSKRVFTQVELLNVRHGSLAYYMACVLKELGAPISFNKLNIYLKPSDIKSLGYIKDRIKNDGSHEFVFEELKEGELENLD